MAGYVYRPEFSYLAFLRAGKGTFLPEPSDRLRRLLGVKLVLSVAPRPAARPAGESTNGSPASSTGSRTPKRQPRRIDASFDWAQSEILAEIGAMADPLERLKSEAADAAAPLTACDRFDVARESLQRGDYTQALHQLQIILQPADKGPAGDTTDFRPHFLTGIIRLGGYTNTDSELVDLAKAESSFGQAARRAERLHAHEAALARLAAGWACYAAGKIEAALTHTRLAVVQVPGLAEAHFQLAKILAHAGRLEEARPVLEKAIELDPQYAPKAERDGSLAADQDLLLDCVGSLKLHSRRRAKAAIDQAARQHSALGLDPKDEGVTGADDDALRTAAIALESAEAAFAEDTVWGYYRALEDANRAGELLAGLINRFQKLKLTADDLIHSVTKELEQIAHLEVGGYRLADFATEDLNRTGGLLERATTAAQSRQLASLLEAERTALRARATLYSAVERFRSCALARASSECAELARTLTQPRRLHSRSEEARLCALAAILIGTGPSGCLAGAEGSLSGPVVVKFLISILALGAVGAAVGALTAPLYDSENSALKQQIEGRQLVLQKSMEQLKGFALNASPAAR